MIDLFTKPTDTHQLLHRASCHPNHTKKGIPYSQALRIRHICSEEQFFIDRVGDLKTWLLARCYGGNEVDSQINRVRDKNRATLLDAKLKESDDRKIPLVLTYHPAMHKVCNILRQNQNLLLVDREHEAAFKDKIFVSFRRAKSLKDKVVRAKLPSIDAELLEKGNFRRNGRRSCQICPLMREGDTFHNFDSTKSFKNFLGRYNCNSDHVVYLLQCESCNKKYVGSTKTKFRQRFNVYKSYFRTYARKHDENSLDKGKPVPQASFFSQFFENGHNGNCRVGIKAPFTRYRFHFISDWVRQSDMKVSPVYTIPFSFHSGSRFCLHDCVSPCTVMVSPYSVMVPLRILRSSPN